MAWGRVGGLPPRRAGPALHTNQAPAGGRDQPNPAPPRHQPWPGHSRPRFPNFPKWLRCRQAHSALCPHSPFSPHPLVAT